MEPFVTLHATGVVLPLENVDTDQIIPARFLKTTDRLGLGNNLFADWRYEASGAPKPEFVLNRPEAKTAQLLVAGKNFGCGSSREHAPWALLGYGFRAIVSSEFADIFRNNALGNGLLPVALPESVVDRIGGIIAIEPKASFTIDLDAQTFAFPSGERFEFVVDPFARHCMLEGVDQLGYLAKKEPEIAAYERARAGAN
ncbi:MAG TPA: 3-isopropylmalate dehydratase small subunit [Gemmatimonadaceae bacterium]|nr:3-isopropylmalate dehydratase small subunit [Gemmatimonadaceae bacterium]